MPSNKKAVNKIMNVSGIVLCVLLIPMLIINLTLIVKSFLYPKAVPSFFGYKPFIVLSGSMEPIFFPGDLTLTRTVKADTLKVGDIIAFRDEDSVTTHRIHKITVVNNKRHFTTKGDNNNVEDNLTITDEMVEGIYVLKVPGLGKAAMFMQKPMGMLLFIALPMMLFILYDIFRRRHYDKLEKMRRKELEKELIQMRQQANTANGNTEQKQESVTK